MNTVEIKITSAGLDNNQANALSNFLTSLGAEQPTEKTLPVEGSKVNLPEEVKTDAQEVEKPKATRTRKAKVEEVKEPVAEAEETSEVEEEELDEEEAAAAITIIEIRALLAKKIDKHKEALKKKLGDFGADKVPNLDPKHYQAFHDFMENLA